MERPVNCPPELYDLQLRCWLEDPSSRPNFTKVVMELNDELESMTSEEYIDIQSPLLSPLTPRSPSESAPLHGLIRGSVGSDVFDSEHVDGVEEDDDEVLGTNIGNDDDSGVDDAIGSSDELNEASKALVDSSNGTSGFRARKESHV